MNGRTVMRGEIWLVDLSLVIGSEQGGKRPCVILQNNVGNRFSPTVIIGVITSRVKKELPTHVYLNALKNQLDHDSYALLEQIRTIDKMRLIEKLGSVDYGDMQSINKSLMVSIGLDNMVSQQPRELEYA